MSRRAVAWLAGLGGLTAVVVASLVLGELVDDTVTALLLLVPIVATSVLGGWKRAVVVSVLAALAYAVAFVPPVGRLRPALASDLVVLATFVATAVAISALSSRRQSTGPDGDDAVLRAVSHDLRTPIGTIRTVSADLLAGTHTDESVRAELLGLVVSESERLDRIVGNLLSQSRVRAGTFVPARAPVALEDVLAASARRLERLGAPPVVVDVEAGLPTVAVDAVQLDQVIANLVENAARHAPVGEPITVRASRRGRVVEVVVADAGPGFTAAARRHAFQPSAMPDGGAGIGLAVCRAVVEGHGGTIAILDGPGARVGFTLPL